MFYIHFWLERAGWRTGVGMCRAAPMRGAASMVVVGSSGLWGVVRLCGGGEHDVLVDEAGAGDLVLDESGQCEHVAPVSSVVGCVNACVRS
ncbi:hypothetical protein AOZ06_08430 [Kibdelosporangium phytohabitans]|uniref:Uncharacterized protein n=1 Tax=Kibdelosporangium phytohabitans TaxID=860235 RepID=A0A0N9HXI6_9PSEU|nr:hypothetical protein AOZ06_08430 [Kibdelosporangium phytohabitans]